MNLSLESAVVWACGVLLAGNLFFVKRLIRNLDDAARRVASLARDVDAIGKQLREIKVDLKDMRRLEIDVAVLRSQYTRPENGDGQSKNHS